MHDLWLSYHEAVLAALLAMLGVLCLNMAVFRSLHRASPPANAPFVSVLVPARNEEHRIAPCVASLRKQNYPHFEVLVLNDHSEDGTERVIRAVGFNDAGPQWRLLAGEPLPDGWVGKNWACHQLSRQARGEYLFFTDADTVHDPDTIAAAVRMAQDQRADLLSAWPRLVTLTWGEKLVIPMIHLFLAGFYPHALVVFLQATPALARLLPRPILRGLGAANGQFLFFHRTAYERIGGHAAVSNHLVEDVALGREVAVRLGEGMRLVNCDGSRLVQCRMYTSLREVWEGFTKNIRPAFENSPALFVMIGVVQFSCFFAPFVAVVLPLEHRGVMAAQIGVIYLIRLILTVRFRTSWLGCVLHPAGHHALAMLISLNSWRRCAGQGVSWKGRTYRPGAE